MLRLVETLNDLFRIVDRYVNPYPVSRLILEHNHFCYCVDYAQLQRHIDRIRVGVNMLIDYLNKFDKLGLEYGSSSQRGWICTGIKQFSYLFF